MCAESLGNALDSYINLVFADPSAIGFRLEAVQELSETSGVGSQEGHESGSKFISNQHLPEFL